MTFVGIVVHLVFNLALGIAILMLADGLGANKELVLAGGALVLAAIALGGGTLLILRRRPWTRGLGLGLMIGWALVTILSAGFCTGVNPSLYTDGFL